MILRQISWQVVFPWKQRPRQIRWHPPPPHGCNPPNPHHPLTTDQLHDIPVFLNSISLTYCSKVYISLMYFSSVFLKCTPPSLLFSSPPSWPTAQYPPECPIPIPIAPLSYRAIHYLIFLLVIWMSVLIKSFDSKRRSIKYCRITSGHLVIFFLWINIVKLNQDKCPVCFLSFHLNIHWMVGGFRPQERRGVFGQK